MERTPERTSAATQSWGPRFPHQSLSEFLESEGGRFRTSRGQPLVRVSRMTQGDGGRCSCVGTIHSCNVVSCGLVLSDNIPGGGVALQ